MPGSLPYTQTPKLFVNATMVGTRFYLHRYFVFPPASEAFCGIDPPEGSFNVIGNGTCGETGFSAFSEYFLTSSYEKDGTLVALPLSSVTSGLGVDGVAETVDDEMLPVGDAAIYRTAALSGTSFVSEFFVFLSETRQSVSNDFYVVNPTTGQASLARASRFFQNKAASEADWLNQLQTAYEENNVPVGGRVQQGQLPMQTACLSNENCPTEQDFCETDPACSESPYQEPDGSVRVGPVVGFVILGIVLLLAPVLLYIWWEKKTQEKRFRRMFAARIAETIELSASNNALTPEGLTMEFKRIQSGLKQDGGKNRYISKEDLWTFVSSGKGGDMTKSDFEALFAAMDIDRDGKVNFLEFCNFLSLCGGDIDEAMAGQTDALDEDQVIEKVARRLSSKSFRKINVDLGKHLEGTEEEETTK